MSHHIKKFIERIKHEFKKIDDEIKNNLDAQLDFVLKVGRHILMSGGKRLRPLLFILSARTCSFDNQSLYRQSVIYEYLHAATLLHDDVIDNSDLRRGKPSANSLWDNSSVVLVGDYLYAKSFSLASDYKNLRIIKVLSDTTATMAEGMILELLHDFDIHMTEKIYDDIIFAKTAILMGAACRNGAIVAKVDLTQEEALYNYGLKIGMAFQMVDDYLDYAGSEHEFGKPVLKDITEGKITLPLIYTLEACDKEEKRFIIETVKDRKFEKERLEQIRELVFIKKGTDKTLERASRYINEAKESLSIFPQSESRTILEELADFIIRRRV